MNKALSLSPRPPERIEQRSIFGRPLGILLATAMVTAAALISILMTTVSTSSVFPWLPAGIAAGLTLRHGSRYAVLGGLTLAAAAGGGFFGEAEFPASSSSREWLPATVMIVLLSVGHAISLALLPRIMGRAGKRILAGQVTSGDATRFVFVAMPLVGLPIALLTANWSIGTGDYPTATLETTVSIMLGLLATMPITVALLPDAEGRRVYRCHSNQSRRFIPAILMVATMFGTWWAPDVNHDPVRLLFISALLASFSWLATQSGWFACSMALVMVAFCEPTSAFGSSLMLLPIMAFGLFIAATMEEHFRNEIHARDQNEQVTALLHATSAAMIEIDLAGRLRFENQAAIDLFSSAPFPAKLGEPLAGMFEPRSRRRILAAIRVALSGQPRECEVSIRNERGNSPMHLAVLTPLHRGSFGIHGCSVVLLDLASTQERARLRELRQERTFTSLAHAIVHDVNDFAMEVGGVASLARDQADETVGEVLAGIEEKCLQAARRTDRIRHIVQIGDNARIIDVGLVAGERLYHHHHGERIRIGVLASEPDTNVRMTESFARFIVDEFVENAIEASSTGLPEIALTCRSHADGRIELQIGDDGPGIPRSIRHQVGKNFVSTRGGGRGLGLRAVFAGVKSTGGRVQITSGEWGTVLKILLPAAQTSRRSSFAKKRHPGMLIR